MIATMIFDLLGMLKGQENSEEREYVPAAQQGVACDHVFIPKKFTDTSVRHNGEVDQFVSNDQSLLLCLTLRAIVRDAGSGEGFPELSKEDPKNLFGDDLMTDVASHEDYRSQAAWDDYNLDLIFSGIAGT